jgi:transposase
MIKYSLGIDVSSKELYACFCSMDQNQRIKVHSTRKFSNTVSGIKALVSWIKQHRKDQNIPLKTLMEATGVYYETCALYLSTLGFEVAVVLPNYAKKYLQSTGIKSKNDKIDAKGLARMAAERSLDQWQPLSEFFFKLRAMTRQYQNLQEAKTSVSNQLHAAENSMYRVKEVIRQLKELMKKLDKQIKQIKENISAHLKADELVNTKIKKASSITGVATLTVAVLVAETNGFELFKNQKQLISYSGYDVVENQSGKREGKTKISKMGNSRIRRALHMPALNVVKYNVPAFVNFYNRNIVKHHIKMKTYTAIQKKLLNLIYTLWKKNEYYNPNIHEQEQVHSSLVGYEKDKKVDASKDAPTQGKHPVNYHSMLPLW